MIKKLRRQFILINMSLVAVVLVVVFAAIGLSSFRTSRQLVSSVLERALTSRFDDLPAIPEIGKSFSGTKDGPAGQARKGKAEPWLPSFCVLVDGSGQIVDSLLQGATVSEETFNNATAAALATGRNQGALYDYNLCYSIRYTSSGTKIAFVDISSVRSSLTSQLVTLVIAGVAGLVAFFFISLLLANWALRPVERSWERQRQFVADASHELKTPLTVVLANTDIVLSHGDEPVSSQTRWLQNTKAESLRMKSLVDDMLFLARADMDVPPQMESISLSDTVWSATLPFEALAFEAGVRLETDIRDGVTIFGNQQQLRQLTAILLDNAVKYVNRGGVITTQLTCGSDGVRLTVNNSGDPIDPEKLPHLFERFYRADAARERATGGYGLGLSIAKSIAELHRANILVTSNAISGTTFTVEWREHALAG